MMGRNKPYKIPSQEHSTYSEGRKSEARNPGSQPIGSAFEPESGLTQNSAWDVVLKEAWTFEHAIYTCHSWGPGISK